METMNSRKRGYTMHQVMQLEIKTETEIFKHFIVFLWRKSAIRQ